jgi:hypothetical protein
LAARSHWPPTPPRTPTAEELVHRITTPEATLPQQAQAFQDLQRLSPADRIAALRQLLASGVEQYAAGAASALIRSGADDLGPAIEARLFRWSDNEQLAVLQAIIATSCFQPPPPPYRQVARMLVHRELDRQRPASPPDDAIVRPADLAAYILRHSASADDAALIHQLLLLRPGSSWIWLAAAQTKAGNTLPQQVKLARTLRGADAAPAAVQVAAAMAVASADPAAAEWALEAVQRFLDQYAQIERTIPATQLTIPPAATDSSRMQEELQFRGRLMEVEMLSLHPSPATDAVLRRALDSKNDMIQVVAAVAASKHAPRLILDTRAWHIKPALQDDLFALVAMRHPDLAAEVQPHLHDQTVDQAIARLKHQGWAAFGAAGAMGL